MTFIVTLIALLLERFFDWSHLRRWDWFSAYQQAIMRRLPGKAPYLILGCIILPLLAATLLIQILLQNVLFGFVELLFQLFIFIYCLGQQNLWADTFASLSMLIRSDAKVDVEKLKVSFGVTETGLSLHQALLSNLFIQANRRVFAVVFWFVILGPTGALLYRTVALSASPLSKQEISPDVVIAARSLQSLLDWIPVRLLTLFFALGGHFAKVLSYWRKKAAWGLNMNDQVLTECGMAALGDNDDHIAQDGSAERNAIGLLDRAFVITLVVIAVLVLVF
jgi:AmpE protein